MATLSSKYFHGPGRKVFYRLPTTEKGCEEGTSDEHALREVLVENCYANESVGFDVLPGEHWLDLGANIGAFAVYCEMRQATADCFEPDKECFGILKMNTEDSDFSLINCAVTDSPEKEISFFGSSNPDNHYRGTIFDVQGYKEQEKVPNLWAQHLKEDYTAMDGIKMDIEGSEFGIIDKWLLPPCDKLVLEYHTSRDPSVVNLRRRVELLRAHFNNVLLTPEHQRLLVSDLEMSDLKMDQIIFCWGAK
jgi:FkbM family methyltransferase